MRFCKLEEFLHPFRYVLENIPDVWIWGRVTAAGGEAPVREVVNVGLKYFKYPDMWC